jgi:hypothetical protein
MNITPSLISCIYKYHLQNAKPTNTKTKYNSYDGRNEERRGSGKGRRDEVEEDLNKLEYKTGRQCQKPSRMERDVLNCRA